MDAKERSARTACLSGDYTKGVALLSELFVSTMDPTYIYNQGRCFEQNRQYEDAIARFQEYLRAGKKLTRKAKSEAQQHIADCKELLAEQQSPPPPPATRPAQPEPAPEPQLTPVTPVAADPPPSVVHEPKLQSEVGSSGAGLRTAGIVTAAVGGAALVAGVILNVKVNSMADSLQKTDGYSDGKESDRKTYERFGWVSYGAGAACVVTGVVLYVLGLRARSATPTSVSLVPVLTSAEAGAVWKGAF